MSFELPALPYDKNALEPHITAETIDFHYGKHHNTYVVKLNELIAGSEYEGKSLEDIIHDTAGDATKSGIFNNAAQIWNHTFYWYSLAPNGGGTPSGELASKIDAAFGSYDKFKEAFTQAAITQFGSGWAWLVADSSGELKIVKTGNAETPLTEKGITPLLTIDVWEHAYYIDYRNRRPDYIKTYLDSLVNWQFAEENYQNALASKAA